MHEGIGSLFIDPDGLDDIEVVEVIMHFFNCSYYHELILLVVRIMVHLDAHYRVFILILISFRMGQRIRLTFFDHQINERFNFGRGRWMQYVLEVGVSKVFVVRQDLL